MGKRKQCKRKKHLFKVLKEIKNDLAGQYILLFLDYDGTLAPITDKPSNAKLSAGIKKLLYQLTKSPGLKLAIVSGRSLADIKKMVGLAGIIYSGNHGLQISGLGLRYNLAASSQQRAIFKEIRNTLERKLACIRGVLVEDKGFSLTLHYRLVAPGKLPEVFAVLRKTTYNYLKNGKINLRRGKKSLEVRLPLRWDKGKAVMWILSKLKKKLSAKNIRPIYIGDDVTDEDAFRVLGAGGISVFVGASTSTSARYYLRNTTEVKRFLKLIQNNRYEKFSQS